MEGAASAVSAHVRVTRMVANCILSFERVLDALERRNKVEIWPIRIEELGGNRNSRPGKFVEFISKVSHQSEVKLIKAGILSERTLTAERYRAPLISACEWMFPISCQEIVSRLIDQACLENWG